MIKSFSKKVLAFNVISACVIASAAAMQVRSLMFPSQPTPCSERMSRSVMLGLEQNGRLLRPSDIQAVSNGADLGVMENLSVVAPRDAPAATALDVFIPAGSSQQGHTRGGGISFPWQPRGIPADLAHACMSYHVYLDPAFDFGLGGSLPGLRGVSRQLGAAVNERFDTHVLWKKDGATRLHLALKSDKGRAIGEVEDKWPMMLPRGRWVRIEQEVILNSPGYSDGTARYWIDGKFAGKTREAALRMSPDVGVSGAMIDVYFGMQPSANEWGPGTAPADSRIQLSAIEIKWN